MSVERAAGEGGGDTTPTGSPIHPTDSAPAHPPGPGCLMAGVWLIVLLGFQTVFVLPVAVVTGGQNAPLTFAFGTTGLFLAVALIVGLTQGPAARRTFAIRSPGCKHLAFVILLSTPLLLALGEANAWLDDAARSAGIPDQLLVPKDLLEISDAIRSSPLWLAAAAVGVFGGLLPAVSEELFFRGLLGRGLVARWGPVRGVLITSLLFGAMHIYPVHMVLATVMGVALHVVYLWTRSLLPPMALHAVYNWQVFSLNAATRGTQHDFAADDHVPPVLALMALLAVAGMAYLLFRSRVRWKRADGTNWSPGYSSAEIPPTEADARLVPEPLRARTIAIVSVVYMLFVAALVWELCL